MEKKKQKFNYWQIGIASFAVVILFGFAVVASADVGGFWGSVADKVAVILAGRVDEPSSDVLGGSTSDDWNVGGNLTVDGTVTFGNIVTGYTNGTLADATTTVLAIEPGVTTTINFLRLDITGPATSTYTVTCGTSSSEFGTPSATLISSGSIVTSSLVILENGVNYPSGTPTGGGYIAAGSFGKLGIESDEWLMCKVTTAYDGAFTEVTNTFAGTYSIGYTVLE